MQRIDVLIAVVLLAAATGSVVGVVVYEGDSSEFRVSFSEMEHTFEVAAQDLTGAGTLDFTFDAPLDNLTRAELTLQVDATGLRAQAVPITVTVHAPGLPEAVATGTIASGGPQSAIITLAILASQLPDEVDVRALDSKAALAEAANTTTLGRGEWHIAVELGAGAPVAQLDTETRTVSIDAVAWTYQAKVNAAVPEAL